MDVFIQILANLLVLAAGASGSVGAFWFYNQLPRAWFLDYDDSAKKDADFSSAPDPRMNRFPDGVWFCAILLFVLFLFYIRYGLSLTFFCNVFSIFFFAYVFVADKKTQIIPDQLIIGMLFVSLLWMVNDMSYIQESGEVWYWGILMRILGGMAGGGILWGIAAAGSKLLKQEAMGMGDVKLILACGLFVGISGIFWVLILSFLFAFFPAVIHAISKRQIKKRIPFAPFIVIAAALYLLFPSEFALFYHWYSQWTF